MCGIAGLFEACGDRSPATAVERMLAAMKSRGPDHTASFRPSADLPGLRVGYNRLSINDWTAAGYQPFTNQRGDVLCVMNGEIYNWKELRRELAGRGRVFQSASDVEVVPYVYEQEGINFPATLNGMFAIAVVDLRQRRLVLARDRVGEKPLFYAYHDRAFVFASTLSAVLASGCTDCRLDRASLSEFLTFRCVPGTNTIVESIKKVPPGGVVTFDLDSGRIESHTYWEPNLWQDPIEDAEEAAEQLSELLVDSVRLRIPLESQVALGTTLSGGIDSSSITALLRQQKPRRSVTAFSAFVKDDPEDFSCIADVCHVLELTHRTVDCLTRDVDLLRLVARNIGEPVAAGMIVPCSQVFQLAHGHGFRALATGEGSDELFAGYSGRLALDGYLQRWDSLLPEERKALLAATPLLEAKLDSVLRRPGLSPLERYAFWDDDNTYNRELAIRLIAPAIGPLPDPLERLRHFDEFSRGASHENRMLYLELRIRLSDFMLPISDRSSMAYSVEARAPLLDPRIINLAFGMHPSLKYRNGVEKWILRRAMQRLNLLPASVLWRRKHPFSGPINTWMKSLPLELENELLPASLNAHGVFDPDTVSQMLNRFKSGSLSKRAQIEYSDLLFAVLILTIWLDEFGAGKWQSVAA